MGKTTGIEWTDHTFNPWIGCQKVSPGCANCYAEQQMAKRWKKVQWGPNGTRLVKAEAGWREPLRWNDAAEAAGRMARVFCASLADIFEVRPELAAPRERLWELIRDTPWLWWLLLTKRPTAVHRPNWPVRPTMSGPHRPPGVQPWPENLWLGTSAEDQARLQDRGPALLRCTAEASYTRPFVAPVYFLSLEPLLERVDLRPLLTGRDVDGPNRIGWVIIGGESGPGARPCHTDWIAAAVDQCLDASVPVFVKQLGEHCIDDAAGGKRVKPSLHRKGGNPDEWPASVPRIREFPTTPYEAPPPAASGPRDGWALERAPDGTPLRLIRAYKG